MAEGTSALTKGLWVPLPRAGRSRQDSRCRKPRSRAQAFTSRLLST